MSLSCLSHFNSSWKWVNNHDWRLCSGGSSWKWTSRLYFRRSGVVTSSLILDLSEALLDSGFWWFYRDLHRGDVMWIVSSCLTLTHLILMASLAAAEDLLFDRGARYLLLRGSYGTQTFASTSRWPQQNGGNRAPMSPGLLHSSSSLRKFESRISARFLPRHLPGNRWCIDAVA